MRGQRGESAKSAGWLAVAMVAALCVIIYGWLHIPRAAERQPAAPDTVRIVVRDTVTITKPVAVTSKPVGIVPVRLPLWHFRDTAKMVGDTSQKSPPDSATVAVPIESKVYADSNYRAVISGYMASLDTMQVYPRTEYVRITPPLPKPKRWGIGLGLGYGMTPKGVQPYLGITLSYNLWQF